MYEFSPKIEKQLERFEQGLEDFTAQSRRQHRNYAGVFLAWLAKKNYQVELVTYEQLMDFMLQQKQQRSDRQVNRILLAIRHYYRVLDLHPCPATGVYIKGAQQRTLAPLVKYKDLLRLYEHYPVVDDRSFRNKVLLSLMIFQALGNAALHQLRPEHIKLKEAKIEIIGNRQSRARILSLEGQQIKEVEKYLHQVRPRMLENLNQQRPGRRPNQVDPQVYEQLFFSQGGSAQIKSSLKMMFRMIKRTYPMIKSAQAIRMAVIAQWLKTEDVRVVQYKAGHKYVSSTERYDQYNLTQLTGQINEKHPWK